MILSKEFYDQCDPSYKKVIDKLEKDLADIDGATDGLAIKTQKVLLAISAFSKRYLIPKEYWQHCLNLIELNNEGATNFYTYQKNCCDFVKFAYFHLCCDKTWNKLAFEGYGESDDATDDESFDESDDAIDDETHDESFDESDDVSSDESSDESVVGSNAQITYFKPYADIYLKLDHFHWGPTIYEDTVITERDISYPHDRLKECIRRFESTTTKLPSKKLFKRCEEMVQLYPKIKAAENDDEEWYKLLLQVGDNAYVRNNVEYRLGQNLLNVKLWKIYIGFLKEYGEYKYLLGVYSKYCRFFLEDHEMKKEYEVAMRKYGPVNLPWENLYDFEVHNGLEEEETQDSEVKEKSPFDKKICAYFYKTRKLQDFSLPGPLVLYLLKNAGHRVLQKLFFSCKYFFAKQPTPICYGIKNGPREFYQDESLSLLDFPEQKSFPKNLYVTGSLFGGTVHIPHIYFLPKLYRCDAKYISLANLSFSFDELKFLIGHGGVIELFLYCKINDENGQFIDLEKIVAFLPNMEGLYLEYVKTNANTGHALAEQKFNSKIYSIVVCQISGVPFDVDEFMKFLTASKDDKQRFSGCFRFNKDFDAAFVEKLKQILDDYKKSNQDVHISADFDYDIEFY